MTRITTEHLVDDAGLAELRRPRIDVVIEVPAETMTPGRSPGPDPGAPEPVASAVATEAAPVVESFDAEDGPFDRYRRTITVQPATEGRHAVTETHDFRMAVPVWRPLLTPLMKRALRPAERAPRRRWWWPEQVVPAATSRLISTVCVIGVMAGYLGVIIGQTITFAAEDFGAGDGAQANTLAAVRVGVLLSLVFLRRADRYGRRPLVLVFTSTAVAFTVLGSLSPNLITLGVTQTIARGLTTGLFTLIVLAATEEAPGAARAFSVSLITVGAALGAGMVVWVLPLADLIEGGWRVVYLVPLLFLPMLWWISRYLPETRRFTVAADHGAPALINRRRLLLLGFAAFSTAVFASPASQLRNEFLRDDLDFSAGAISVFQLVVSAPAGTAIILAGVLADRMGRRWIGAVGIGLGAIATALSYQVGGAGLWVFASIGVVVGSASIPAMRGYQTELFPTRARAKVGGILDAVAVAGSATGLVTVGYLAERWDNLADAITVMIFAPLLCAVAIIAFFPETARRELEAFNPDDPELPTPTATPPPTGGP